MGQTVTDLPSNATPSDLESAADLEKMPESPETLEPNVWTRPNAVDSAFENAASVTEPEIEVTAQGNVGKDPETKTETGVRLTTDEVYELNVFLSHSKFTLAEFERLKPVFEKLKTPTRGGWWGLGLLDRL